MKYKKKNPVASESIVPVERIEKSIFLIRGKKVMLDRDLAAIYGVPTFRFNEAVKRNKDRFPEDFMFQLTQEEVEILISQNAMSKPGRGGRRTLPYVLCGQSSVNCPQSSVFSLQPKYLSSYKYFTYNPMNVP